MRRFRAAAVTAATLLATSVLGSSVATAASQATSDDVHFLAPARDQVLTDRVTLDVEVRLTGVKKVDLRLTQDGQAMASGTAFVSVPCFEGCDGDGPTRWGNRTYDPSMGAPFSPNGQCNGRWMLQPRIDGGAWLDPVPFLVSVMPKTPSNVKIVVDANGDANVSWTADRSPDVSWHRVERSTGGGPFTELATLDGSASSFVDANVPYGDHVYRIVAARPDGRVNGSPAAPCADKGADLVATSRNVTLKHSRDGSTTEGTGEEPRSGSGSSSSGSSGSGEGTAGSQQPGSGSSGQAQPSEEPRSPEEQAAEQEGQPSGQASEQPRPRRSARPVPPPPSAQRRTNTTVEAPALGGSNGEDDGYYYGEGMEFSEEIDYGDAPVIEGQQFVGFDEDGEPMYEAIRQPGEVVAFGVVTVDGGKIRMLASGLLMVALALHGRRWLNAN